jgi:hypothetical protein
VASFHALQKLEMFAVELIAAETALLSERRLLYAQPDI